MSELGSCGGGLSGEHLISEAVCRALSTHGSFSVSGFPWLDEGEERAISPGALKAKCLCVRHNSALTLLDEAAKILFINLRSFLEVEKGHAHVLMSGHDVERWLLKTAKAMAVSGNLASGRRSLPGFFKDNDAILDLLDNPAHWPDGAGLYCEAGTADVFVNYPRFSLMPMFNDEGEIEALRVSVLGLVFTLMLTSPDPIRHAFLQNSKYQPGRLIVSYPATTKILTLSWVKLGPHEHLLVRHVQAISQAS